MCELMVRAVDTSWKRSYGGRTIRSQVLVAMIIKGRAWPVWSWSTENGSQTYWNPTLAERVAEAERP